MHSSWNCLHKWVVRYGDDEQVDVETLNRMLQQFDVASETSSKCIAHHFAAIADSQAVLLFLLQNTPQTLVNKRNKNGQTPLFWACFSMHSALKNFKLLLKYGSNPKHVDSSGNTVLHAAIENGNFQLVSFIVSKSLCLLDTPNGEGLTPLKLACERSEAHIISRLVKLAVGTSSLCELIREYTKQDDTIVVASLIRHATAAQCTDEKGRNPLHVAVLLNKYNVVKKILSQHSAEHCWFDQVDSEGRTAAQSMTTNTKPKIRSLLTNHVPCTH